jgi:hypothetical protein
MNIKEWFIFTVAWATIILLMGFCEPIANMI